PLDEGSGSAATNRLTGAASNTNLSLTNATWMTPTMYNAMTGYTEQASDTSINPMFGVWDLDNTVITATIRISGGFMADDLLSLSPITSTMGGIQQASYVTSTGVLTLNAPVGTTPLQWSHALRAIKFSNPVSDNPGTSRTLGLIASSATASSTEQTLTFGVTPINDAPTATALTFTAIVEDVATAANTGDTVATLATSNTDSDTGAAKGIAITAAPSTDGQWQYSANGGTSWTSITNVSNSAALLLPGSNINYKVRFVPVNNFAGTVALTYRAWDETSGTAGSTTNTTTNGGSTAFSSNTATATITVGDSIDAAYVSAVTSPKAVQFNGTSAYLGSTTSSFNNLTTFTLAFWVNPSRLSGEQGLVGQNDALEVYLNTVSGVTSLMVYMGGPNRADGIDVSTAALMPLNTWTHVVIVGDSNRGTLQIYLNGVLRGTISGITASHFGTSSSTMRVAGFVNNTVTPTYFQGAIDEISLWNTTLPAEDVAALRTYKPVGGTSNLVGYWSLDEGTGSSAANGVTGAASATNLTLTNATWTTAALDPAIASYSEQAGATAINPMVGVFDLDRAVITATVRITSGFVAGDLLRLTPITSTMGSIQLSSYLTSTGVLTLVAPSPATPTQWTAALRALTFENALSDNPGSTRTLGFVVQTASTTSSEQTLSFAVNPVNDAPTAVNNTLTSIAEDVASAANTGTSVATIASTNTDPDTGASKGLAITGVNTSDGQWQYTSNGGTSWSTISAVSDSAALLLPGSNSNYKIRFVPVNNFY
ncbi:MAG: LamG-like jellyroll fold domain-containing protein, partial [Roseiflexaceae bacterium]